MKKILVFFTMVLSFLFLPILKVDGISIPNVSEVKMYNLVWVEKATWGDTTEHDLLVEIAPDNYEPINAVLTYEAEFLKLYGVVVFNYPRILDTAIDTKSIYYQKNPNTQYQSFTNVDFIVVKKMSNKLEIYLNTANQTYNLDYYEGISDFGGIRTTENNTDIDYTYYGNVIDGIYYNSSRNSYIWVMSVDIPWSTPVKITTDFDGMLHFFNKDLGDYNSDGDIVYMNTDGSYFKAWWQDSIHIDKLVNSGYFFYEITGGVMIPPIENVLKVEMDYIVPIYPANRLDYIIDIIEHSQGDGYTYEDLVEEYEKGYEWGYEQGDAAGYERGIQEEIETGGFGLLLKQTFIGIGSFLGIELLPNITIGAIIAVPIVFGLIAFILGRKRE